MIFENNIQAKELSREDCVLLEASSTAGEALEKFRDYEFDYGAKSIYYVFVVKDNEFKGVVSVKELLESDKDTELREILVDDIITVSPNDNLEDVARLMSKHDFQALPVTEENNFLGIVRLDEMLEVLDEAATEDIFRKAGILNMSKKEITKSDAVLNTSIFNEIKIRLPWLLFALLGGLIAAQVIEGFEAPLQATVTLAFFLPLIMDMGGNVGTQSSTIFVRGVVLGQISDKDIVSRIVKEMVSGGLIGLITGALSAIAAYIFYGDVLLSLVLVSSMTVTCLIASFIGFLIPWAAYKTGKDPAAVSDPIITTIKDITALIVYFGFATLLMGI